jgi:Tol biopolymer transport system component
MRIDVDGGNRRELAEAPMADGGTWSPDGTIVFAPGGWGAPIAMIDEQSGPVTDVADADPQGMTDYMQSPSFLPDGVHFLFSVHEQSTQGSGIWLGTTDGSAPRHLLTATVSSPVYVDPGFVMYWTPDGRVIARPFDLATSTFGDEETVVATDVGFSWIVSGLFTASRSGLVAYLATGSDGAGSELAWVNRLGEFIERLAPASGYYAPRLSRDGRRVVVDNSTPLADLYVFTTPGRPPNRLTDDPADETLPVWSFDDTAVYFYRVGATEQIFRRRLVDGDTPVMLIDDGAPVDASPDGRWLLFRRHVEGQSDMFGLCLFDLESNAERPWVASPYSNRSGAFAPDGGWIAYCTNETGRLEIYLQTYPDLGTKIAVSADGGVAPIWSSDGRTLYYRSLTDQVIEVPILFTADQPDVGTARPLFEMPMRTLGGWAPQFAPSTDGQRFLVNRLVEGRSELPMMLLQNWMSRVRR